MESLETTLKKVQDLKIGLYADLIPEQGHYDFPEGRSFGSDESQGIWTVDKPGEPDKERREAARVELQKIYDSSEWYSARYDAGSILGIEMRNQLKSWAETLKGQLTAETTRKKAHQDLKHMYRNLHRYKPSLYVHPVGKALGYSSLRIWAHVHPAAATLIGIVAAGAASGLVYAFSEYFSK